MSVQVRKLENSIPQFERIGVMSMEKQLYITEGKENRKSVLKRVIDVFEELYEIEDERYFVG